MSEQEIDRVSIIERVKAKRMTQLQAANILGISTRQFRNLRKKYDDQGPSALISKRRGRPSNNRLKDDVKKQIIDLVKQHYSDFGPTLAAEKLCEKHQLKISVESLRKLMVANHLWGAKKRKKVKIHPMRPRREQYGELIQIDGSPHAWFEDRGPTCCLLAFVDDATSSLMQLYFVERECSQGYFTATEHYLERHGRPLALYSDKHYRTSTTIADR